MSYILSTDVFKKTFAMPETTSKPTHNSGKKIKLFPFVTSSNNTSPPVYSLKGLAGDYLCRIKGVKASDITIDELYKKLKEDSELTIATGYEEMFYEVLKCLYFEKNEQVKPINLRMVEQTKCQGVNESNLSEFLVAVLADQDDLKRILDQAHNNLETKANVLDKFVLSKLEFTQTSEEKPQEYFRVVDVLRNKFKEDFDFIMADENRIKEYLVPLLELYYFTYVAQTALQLNSFLDGARNRIIPLYFAFEREKTSQNRMCYKYGWSLLQDVASKMFAHAIVLEILNQTENDTVQYDYIKLNNMIEEDPDMDEQIAEQIKTLVDFYRNSINDCAEMKRLERDLNIKGKTEREIRFLFDSVKTQFIYVNNRNRPYNDYANKFIRYCDKFLKNRGRSGKTLNLTDETLIFLTKISVKEKEKMRLKDVFDEFESRGVFLDNLSKEQIAAYYEKLNLIEKKSDSGDAKYVKRIL